MTTKSHTYLAYLTVLLLINGVTACSAPTKSNPITIKRVILLNQTSKPLTDVRIYVNNTREYMTCGYILPESECSTGFPLREYQENRLEVTWLNNKQLHRIKDIEVTTPEKLITNQPVNAVIVFGRYGQFSATFQPQR